MRRHRLVWNERLFNTNVDPLVRDDWCDHDQPSSRFRTSRRLGLILSLLACRSAISWWCRFWTSDIAIGKQAVAQSGAIGKQPVSQLNPQSVANAAQAVSQIPWGHNILLIQKLDSPTDALFYVQKTIENNWSRSVLTHQIESGLHLQEGKAIDNFDATLPTPESDLARQLLRDPYNFDFLTLTKRHSERELENGLIDHRSDRSADQVLIRAGRGLCIRWAAIQDQRRRR